MVPSAISSAFDPVAVTRARSRPPRAVAALEDYAASRAVVSLQITSRGAFKFDISELENSSIQHLLPSGSAKRVSAATRHGYLKGGDARDMSGAKVIRAAVCEIRRDGDTTIFALRFDNAAAASDETAKPACGGGLPDWRMKRVCAFIDANLDEPVSLKRLADLVGLSPTYFSSQFKETTGLRPREYILHRKISSAKQQLLDLDFSIIEIALSVGFQTHAHFSTAFRRIVGMSPSRWRNENYRDRTAPSPPQQAGT